MVLARATTVGPAGDPEAPFPVVFHVAGGDAGGQAFAARTGPNATIDAAFYVPFGTVSLGPGTAARGSFIGRHVRVGRGSTLALPTAEEGGTQDPPDQDDPPGDGEPPPAEEPPPADEPPSDPPDRDDPSGDPPPADDPPTDPPPQDLPDQDEPPSLDAVVAFDVTEDTFSALAVNVALLGAAPEGVDLVFEILVPPTHGSLGPPVPGEEVPCRSATVRYEPEVGFAGADGFAFRACGTVSGRTVCDDAVAAIEVVEQSCATDPAFCDDGR